MKQDSVYIIFDEARGGYYAGYGIWSRYMANACMYESLESVRNIVGDCLGAKIAMVIVTLANTEGGEI